MDGGQDTRLRRWFGGRLSLARLAWRTSPGISAATAVAALVAGLVPTVFTISSGAVVGALPAMAADGRGSPAGGRVAVGLAVIGGLYLLMQVLIPVKESVSRLLMGRIDAALALRVMSASARPPGVGHLEDPAMLDRIVQAQGAITSSTPGSAAYALTVVWSQRLMATTSLLVVATFRWWLPLLLVAGYALAFAWRRRNWRLFTRVVYGRSETFRRSFYLRRLATEPAAAKETRVFDLDEWLIDNYRSHFDDAMRPIWRERRMGGVIALAVSGVIVVLQGAALLIVADAGLDGAIGLGAVVVYGGCILQASRLGTFSTDHANVEDGLASLRVLEDLEAARNSVAGGSSAGTGAGATPPAGAPRRCIRFEGVSFRYPGRDQDVFDGLDLEIEAGCSLAIVGENGAGKTTLVKLLARLYEPTAGRITVDGIDLRELDAAAWQRHVGAIFQDFTRYQFSAYDNVAVGALHLAGDQDAVHEAAASAGAATLVETLPRGWDTPLSRQFTDGVELSGGEWQKVALARALFAVAGGATVLVLDEPTAALDVRAEAEIYDRYLDLTRGVTTVLISHRFSTVRRAARIVVLDSGRVVEDGSHDELVAQGGRYAHMYNLQAQRFRDGDGASD